MVSIKEAFEKCSIKTTQGIKVALYRKFMEEGSSFTLKDIKIKNYKNKLVLTIKDYEHIFFLITFEYDDFFHYVVEINGYYTESEEPAIANIWFDSKYGYSLEWAIIELGYSISQQF